MGRPWLLTKKQQTYRKGTMGGGVRAGPYLLVCGLHWMQWAHGVCIEDGIALVLMCAACLQRVMEACCVPLVGPAVVVLAALLAATVGLAVREALAVMQDCLESDGCVSVGMLFAALGAAAMPRTCGGGPWVALALLLCPKLARWPLVLVGLCCKPWAEGALPPPPPRWACLPGLFFLCCQAPYAGAPWVPWPQALGVAVAVGTISALAWQGMSHCLSRPSPSAVPPVTGTASGPGPVPVPSRACGRLPTRDDSAGSFPLNDSCSG